MNNASNSLNISRSLETKFFEINVNTLHVSCVVNLTRGTVSRRKTDVMSCPSLSHIIKRHVTQLFFNHDSSVNFDFSSRI